METPSKQLSIPDLLWQVVAHSFQRGHSGNIATSVAFALWLLLPAPIIKEEHKFNHTYFAETREDYKVASVRHRLGATLYLLPLCNWLLDYKIQSFQKPKISQEMNIGRRTDHHNSIYHVNRIPEWTNRICTSCFPSFPLRTTISFPLVYSTSTLIGAAYLCSTKEN